MEAESPLLIAKQKNFLAICVLEPHSLDSALLVVVFGIKSGEEAYHS